MSQARNCPITDCQIEVSPNSFMCSKHWDLVPSYFQQLLCQLYPPGPNVNKTPSRTWLKYFNQAVLIVKQLENKNE